MARTKASNDPDQPVPDDPDQPEEPVEPSEARRAFLAGETRWRDYVEAENG
jgi:hypothetical protein